MFIDKNLQFLYRRRMTLCNVLVYIHEQEDARNFKELERVYRRLMAVRPQGDDVQEVLHMCAMILNSFPASVRNNRKW